MYVSPTGNSKLHSQIITKDGLNKQKKSDFRNAVELSHSQNISNHDNMVLYYKETYETMAAGGSFVNGAYYTMYYTENSTEENPIVTAVGADETGKKFEFDISINDIDPNNANFLEMMTLMTHRSKDFTAGERSKLMGFMEDPPEISMVEKANYVNFMESGAEKARNAGFMDISQSYSVLAAKLKNYFIQRLEEQTADIFDI